MMMVMMSKFDFTFLVSGVDPHADDFADRFFEAGCDDATLMLVRGLVAVCFSREAENYSHAVISAYSNLIATGAIIERFEPDFLVSQSEIAARSNLTRAAINLYVAGSRGRGDFPAPVARITSPSPLWDWVEVSSWLHKNDQLPSLEVVNARISRTVNWFVQNPDAALKKGDKELVRRMEGVAKEPLAV